MQDARTVPAPEPQHLKRIMGTPALIFFGLAYMVPLTVFTTYGIVSGISDGHVPTAYLITVVAMLFTTFSYAMLSRRVPRAGSAYAYTRHAFGPHVGFLTGWALMADYMLLPMINFLVTGLFVSATFPAIPMWAVILIAVSIVTTLNLVGIAVVRNVNVVLVLLQVVFLVVFVILAFGAVEPGTSLTAPFLVPGMEWAGIFSGASILALSFLGFDAISTLSEEAKNPRRTVPRAIVLTTLIGGALFTFISWLGHIAFPDWTQYVDLDTAAIELMNHIGGAFLQTSFLVAGILGALASATASQASVSRILYAMGRDRIFPRRVFGTLSRRFQTPTGPILIVSAVGLLALVLPLDLVASVISFGALVAFSLINLALFTLFWKGRGSSESLPGVAGPISLIGFLLTVWLWLSLSGTALAVGGVWLGLGFVYLLVLTRGFRRQPPEVAVHAGDE